MIATSATITPNNDDVSTYVVFRYNLPKGTESQVTVKIFYETPKGME